MKDKEERKYDVGAFERLLEDCLSDRRICREAGAKYHRMNKEDVSKVREYLIRIYESEVERRIMEEDRDTWFI